MEDQPNKNENRNKSNKSLLGSLKAERMLHNNVNTWTQNNYVYIFAFKDIAWQNQEQKQIWKSKLL